MCEVQQVLLILLYKYGVDFTALMIINNYRMSTIWGIIKPEVRKHAQAEG
jgi:hypothetical protein